MREIKFRAWDKKFKRMHLPEISEVFLDFEGMVYYCGSFHPDYQDRFIIQQFTNLKDKKGKEIYIGDIIHWDDSGIILIKETEELGIYYDEIKSFEENIIMHDIRFYRSDDDCTVIGNIHENPKMKNKTYWTKKKIKLLK